MSRIVRVLSICSLVLCAGCGSSDEVPSSTKPNNESTAATAGLLTGTLAVPADFKGEAVRIVLAATSRLPLAGPPDGGVILEDKAPRIAAGGSYAIKVDASALVGKYHVLAIVFVKGGGTFSPKADVDYDAASSAALSFDGKSTVDIGTLTVAVHKPSDGH